MHTTVKKIVFLCLLLAVSYAQAAMQNSLQNQTVVSEILFCNEANLTLEQATQCDYQVTKKTFQPGFVDGPRWIRLRVISPSQTMPSIAVHVGPHFLTDIQLFEKIGHRWHSQVAGSRYPITDMNAKVGGYSFIVPTQSSSENTYYLRINTMGLSHFFIVVEPWPSANPYNHKLSIGMQLGGLLLVLAFAVISYWINPNQVMLRFGLLMLTIVLGLIAGSGILAHYFLRDYPAFNQLIFSWLICLRLALWIGLSRSMLKPYQTPLWYILSCRITYGIAALSMVLIALNLYAIAYGLTFTALLIAPMVQILAIWRSHDIEKPNKRALLLGFATNTVLILIAALAVIYSVGGSYFPIYVARLTDFTVPLVLLTIILFQQRMKNLELVQVKNELLEKNLRTKFEQKLLAERSLLIDMLTHELKNPLTTISMAAGSLSHDLKNMGIANSRRLDNIKLSIANMDSIIERCALMNLVDQHKTALSNEPVDLRRLINDCIKNLDRDNRIDLAMTQSITIMTDPYLLEIVINNLISNALKYAMPAKRIRMAVNDSAIANTNTICVQISNAIKPTMAPDEAAIFKRFYRHPLALKTSGSGLGLFLSHGICHMLGGTLSYARTGNTVQFSVDLPT
ncbi:HATPase domain containing protein [Methylophilaceae bacterium]